MSSRMKSTASASPPDTARSAGGVDGTGGSGGQGRVAVLLVAGVLLLLGVGAYLLWRHLEGLDAQVAALTAQTEELNDEVARARERAEAAENRARQAATDAEAASQRAAESTEEARAAQEAAELSSLARSEAESARVEAEVARQDAERRRAAAQSQAAKAREAERQAQAEVEALKERRRRELDRLERALNQIAETQRTALGVVMNLGSDRVEFDFDKAELRPENRELLSRIVGVLLTADDFEIQVFGHTDDVGSDAYNQELSEERAKAVRDYLVGAGLNADIIATRGFGKSRPLVEGTDPESRQRNRRVEIAVTQTVLDFTPVSTPAPEPP